MFKTELKNFTVSVGQESVEAKVPMSLFSVLKENGVIKNPYYRDEVTGGGFALLEAECEISTYFFLSSDAAKLRFAFLRIPDLDTSATVVFNGKTEFVVSAGREHKLDVSGLAVTGENTVVIKVAGAQTARDVTLFFGIEFFAFSQACIADITARTVFVADSISVDVGVEFLGAPEDVKAVVTLISPSGKIYYGGVTNGRTLLSVPDPLLWWPGQYGVQNLYKLGVNLYYENEVIDSRDVKIGLRSVYKDARSGGAFTVNGTEFFAMGSEYVMNGPTPAFLASVESSRLIPAAAMANMNFIRFRGEGRYPCDVFLDYCDKYGIAVEFVIKSKKLENSDVDAFKRELAYNVKRLSRHPSLICIAYERSEFSEEYEKILAEIKSASLSNVLVRELEEDETFVSFASIPDLKTLRAVCEPEDMNLFTYVMDKHTASPDVALAMLAEGSKFYKYANGIDEIAYMSELVQARSAKMFVNEKRFARDTAGAAVIAYLNDATPSVSPSIIDFYGRPKSAYYLASRFFAPVYLFVRREEGFSVDFVLSNETKRSQSGVLRYAVRDAHNGVIYEGSKEVGADKYTSSVVHSVDFAEWLSGHERTRYLEYSFSVDGVDIITEAELFVPPKYFKFADALILSEIGGSEREFRLTVTSNAFAKDVVFSFDGIDAVFEENCVDFTNDKTRRIAFVTASPTTAAELMKELRLHSASDIGKVI